MPTARVQRPNVISLNGHQFWIEGRVQRQIANQFAEKTVTEDYSEKSDPILSAITWRGFEGGQGRYILRPNEDGALTYNEFWIGDIRNDVPGHTLSGTDTSFTLTFGSSASSNDTTQALVAAAWLKAPWASDPSINLVTTDSGSSHHLLFWAGTDSGATHKAALASAPRNIAGGYVNGQNYLLVAETSAVQWASNVQTLFTDTAVANVRDFEVWRGLIWAITDSGALYMSAGQNSTADLGLVKVAQLETHGISGFTSLPYVKKLVKGSLILPESNDHEHLFAIKGDGVDVYDRLTETFQPLFTVPWNDFAGQNAVVWNGMLYYPYGMSLFQVTPTPNGTVIEDVGPTNKEGQPDARMGYIFDVAANERMLFITTKRSPEGAVTDTNGYSVMYSRTAGTGWTEFARSSANGLYVEGQIYVGPPQRGSSRNIIIPGWHKTETNVVPSYDIQWGSVNLNNDSAVNRLKLRTAANADPDGQLISPWIVADANQNWTAYRFSVELDHLRSSVAFSSAHSSFGLDYAVNFNDSEWTNVISVNSDTATGLFPSGLFEQSLPNASSPVGVPFSSIRWRTTWGNSKNNGYDLHRVSLVFQKRPKLRYAFTFDIDYTRESPEGRSPKEQREFLDEFYKQATLAEFTYHDEHPGGGQTYYVTALQPVAQEGTGTKESGVARMTVMEAVSKQ